MSAQRLRPQAEGALSRTAARGVKRHIRIQQERNVVFRDVQIALVDLGDVGQRIQILNLRSVRIVDDLVVLQIRNAGNLLQRLPLGIIDDGEVEFLAANEINLGALAQRFLRQHGNVRSDKGNLDGRVGSLDGFHQPHIAREIQEWK